MGHRVSGRKVDAVIWEWLKGLLLNPERLRENMVAYLQQQEEVIAPLRRQLEVSTDLLTQKKREYDELLELYLTSKVRKDVLDTKAQALDTEIGSLERTHRELTERLDAAALTQERVAGLEQFAAEIQKHLDYADGDFAKRHWLVETLDVTAVYRKVDGEKILDAQCIIGEKALTEYSIINVRPNSQNHAQNRAFVRTLIIEKSITAFRVTSAIFISAQK